MQRNNRTSNTHALVPVVLGDIDLQSPRLRHVQSHGPLGAKTHRELDVLENNVAPNDVGSKTVATSPTLEAGTVEFVLHNDVLEGDVGNVVGSTTTAQRANRKTMTSLAVVVSKRKPLGILHRETRFGTHWKRTLVAPFPAVTQSSPL